VRHTRDEVRRRTAEEFARLDRLIARLAPGDWDRPVPRPESRDPWTVKDALVHIVWWKEHTTRVVRRQRRPPEFRGLDVPEVNRLVYERWRTRPPAEVVEWHHRVHEDAMRALDEAPASWFGQRERSPAWPGDFDGHSAAHRVRDVEAALAEG
jgi:Mycothiol maleylpyruvate isomerase N-terminal domain